MNKEKQIDKNEEKSQIGQQEMGEERTYTCDNKKTKQYLRLVMSETITDTSPSFWAWSTVLGEPYSVK